MAAAKKTPSTKSGQEMLEEGASILRGSLYPNMDDLPELSVSTVLANVEGLYSKVQCSRPTESKRNKIYSTVGPVLIAVNPFEKLDCFDPDWAVAFRSEGAAGTVDTAWQRLGPHCFGTMEQVYQGLSRHPKQSVIICGESGAGKTYTNKYMMEYLLKTDQTPIARVVTAATPASGRERFDTRSSGMPTPSRKTVRQGIDMTQLASSNELLEAFGNAKTSRNNNSSRFGKLSKLFMGGEPMDVRGLEIEHYLLERSRVVSVPSGERNYHILHMLAHEENKDPDGGFFRYIPTGVQAPEDIDDEQGFMFLKETMLQARFDEEQMQHIFNYITAVLYLGNVEFQEQPQNQEASQVSKGMSEQALSKACSLLGIDASKFGGALTKKILKTRSEGDIELDVNVDEASDKRDSVAKMLYSRIFDWIIKTMNNKLAANQKGSSKPTGCVGLLDIFGFEDMPINGFEQMFINLTNEKIQHLFNQLMIERELQVYGEEGIESSYEPPPGNDKCLDLFLSEKPQGMVAAIADRIKSAGKEFSKMDGAAFVRQLNKNFKQQNQEFYIECTPSMISEVMRQKKKRWGKDVRLAWEECFQVKHYAGTVTYELKGFLPKSTDAIEDHIFKVLVNSEQDDMKALVATPDQLSGSDKRLTVGEKFKIQLKSLSQELESSSSVFVRCIKPTPKLKPNYFDADLVLEQLKCGGVVSALEMRAASLPDRLSYGEFVEDYCMLEMGEYRTAKGRKAGKELQRCEEILKNFVRQVRVERDGKKEDAWVVEWCLDGSFVVWYDEKGKDGKPVVEKGVAASRVTKDFALGNTKVFLRTGVLAYLRGCLQLKRNFAAISLQYAWLAFKGKRLVSDMQKLQKDLNAKVEAAEHYGLMQVAPLEKAVTQANKCVSESMKRVEAYKESQPQLQGIQAEEWPKDAGVKVMLDVVNPDQLTKMKRLVKAAIEQVDIVSKRRADAEGMVDELLGRRKKEVDDWLTYLDDVDESCQGATEQEAECLQLSAKAREHLDRLMTQEFPVIQKKLLRELDYSRDIIPESIKTPPELAALLTESDVLIARVKDAGQSLMDKRRQFQQETLENNPKVQQMMQEREAMRARLKSLEAKASEEFFYEVNEAIAKALQLDTKCDELWRQAKSPDAFTDGLQRYLQAGEAALESMKMAMQQKQKEEEQQRQVYQRAVSSVEKHEELKRAQSTCMKLEAALLEMQNNLVEQKQNLHDQIQDTSKELEQQLRDEVQRVHVQVEGMAKTLKDMTAAQKDLSDSLTGEQVSETQRLQKYLDMERARNQKLQTDYKNLTEELKAALKSGSNQSHGPELSSVLARCEKLQEEIKDTEMACVRAKLNQRERELDSLQGMNSKLAEVQQQLVQVEARGDQELLKKQSHEQESPSFIKELLQLEAHIHLRDELQASRQKCESLTRDMDQLRQELATSETSRQVALQKAAAMEPTNTHQENRRQTVKDLLNRSDSPDAGTPITSEMLQNWSILKAELEDERDRCNILNQDLNKANKQLIEAREALAASQAAGNSNAVAASDEPAGEPDRNTATVSVGGHAISARATACLSPEEQSIWHKFSSAIHTQRGLLWCASRPALNEQ